MISGYKQTVEKINIRLNIFQKIFAIIWIVVSLYSLYYLTFIKNNVFIASSHVEKNYIVKHKDIKVIL